MRDPLIERTLRTFAAARNYPAATVDRWLELLDTDAAALLELATEIRPTANQLRDLWDWAEEIAERDGLRLAQVLAADAIGAARRRNVSRNDTLKLVKAALRQLRFPRLTEIEGHLRSLVRELGLPRTVNVRLPEFLEGDQLRIEITADNPQALREAGAQLVTASTTATCQEIFRLLAEAS
jgi:hypothetical protein